MFDAGEQTVHSDWTHVQQKLTLQVDNKWTQSRDWATTRHRSFETKPRLRREEHISQDVSRQDTCLETSSLPWATVASFVLATLFEFVCSTWLSRSQTLGSIVINHCMYRWKFSNDSERRTGSLGSIWRVRTSWCEENTRPEMEWHRLTVLINQPPRHHRQQPQQRLTEMATRRCGSYDNPQTGTARCLR